MNMPAFCWALIFAMASATTAICDECRESASLAGDWTWCDLTEAEHDDALCRSAMQLGETKAFLDEHVPGWRNDPRSLLRAPAASNVARHEVKRAMREIEIAEELRGSAAAYDCEWARPAVPRK